MHIFFLRKKLKESKNIFLRVALLAFTHSLLVVHYQVLGSGRFEPHHAAAAITRMSPPPPLPAGGHTLCIRERNPRHI